MSRGFTSESCHKHLVPVSCGVMRPTGWDGLITVGMGYAAHESIDENRAVRVCETTTGSQSKFAFEIDAQRQYDAGQRSECHSYGRADACSGVSIRTPGAVILPSPGSEVGSSLSGHGVMLWGRQSAKSEGVGLVVSGIYIKTDPQYHQGWPEAILVPT